MFTFGFAFVITLLPHFTVSKTFLRFKSDEYYIETNNPVRSYSEAEERCNALQATLAVVNKEDINAFLERKIEFLFNHLLHLGYLLQSSQSFYIGLKRNCNKKYKYGWIDGSPLNYTDWFRDEPNNVTNPNGTSYKGCVTMEQNWYEHNEDRFEWRSVSCNGSAQRFFICQRDSSNTYSSAFFYLAIAFGIITLTLAAFLIVLLPSFFMQKRKSKCNIQRHEMLTTQPAASTATTDNSATTTTTTIVQVTPNNSPKEVHQYEEMKPSPSLQGRTNGYLKMKPIYRK